MRQSMHSHERRPLLWVSDAGPSLAWPRVLVQALEASRDPGRRNPDPEAIGSPQVKPILNRRNQTPAKVGAQALVIFTS